MKVDKDTLCKIAHLARLNIDPSEEEGLMSDFNEILEWVGQLKEAKVGHIPPLTHMTGEVHVLRKDHATQSITHEQAMKNAPDQENGFFKVPKVLRK